MNERRMTVKDGAEYLHLSSDQIYRLAQQGKIPAFRVGARWRFKREKMDEWVEKQWTAQKAGPSVGGGRDMPTISENSRAKAKGVV